MYGEGFLRMLVLRMGDGWPSEGSIDYLLLAFISLRLQFIDLFTKISHIDTISAVGLGMG